MEAVRPQAKDLIANEIAQSHHGAVIIGDGGALERPDVGGKDLFEVLETPDVGILHDLPVVVIDETIEQNVQIRQGGAGQHGHDKEEGTAV
jgi:hypothetical protein